METLFEQLVSSCGLSPLFAERAMVRALSRVGVETPREVTRTDLARALPEVRKAIAPFLEERVDEVMQRLSSLARVQGPGLPESRSPR